MGGPVDEAPAVLGRVRRTAAVVPGVPVALAIARESEQVALVPERQTAAAQAGMHAFPLPVLTVPVTIELIWSARRDADPWHVWLAGVVLAETGLDCVPGTP